jgi:SAM-dependent methyltransferase
VSQLPQDFDADAYEAMIDWPRRLANETPLFRWVFQQVRARRVLDAACGTGHHANLFHSWGLHVEGADVNESMIARCRQQWGESDSLRWCVRGFDQAVDPPGSFDVAICTGNSLALAPDLDTVARAMQELLRAVRADGVVLIHVLNLSQFPDGPCVWQKCLRAHLPDRGNCLIVKGVHRAGSRGFVDVLIASLDSDPPKFSQQSVPLLHLDAEQLAAVARQSGATDVSFFGNYQRSPFDARTSPDLLMLAVK